MDDIVERLRGYDPHPSVLELEAADEIERLRATSEAQAAVGVRQETEIEQLRADLKEELDRPSVRAIYDTALEEAAKLVDDMLLADLGEEIAAAIRALKERP